MAEMSSHRLKNTNISETFRHGISRKLLSFLRNKRGIRGARRDEVLGTPVPLVPLEGQKGRQE